LFFLLFRHKGVQHYYKTYRQYEVAAYMYFAIITFSHIFLGSFFYKNMVVIYVFLLEEAMYSYCYLCILIVSLCYRCLCVLYVFIDAATLTEGFPYFFLSCKANARVNLAKTGHGPHSPKLLCCSMYCLFSVVLCIVCV